VVGLEPAFAPASVETLLLARINLVRQTPRGFAIARADTLSDDPDLEQVSVRRLLTLLRRVALERGARYVFEPHDARLRREVEAHFESLLADLFARGAFAGTRSSSAYRISVDVDATALDIDQGRMLIRLEVAPAAPLTFITLVLEQRGGLTRVREVA
jgi:phage tail sheath protein FI